MFLEVANLETDTHTHTRYQITGLWCLSGSRKTWSIRESLLDWWPAHSQLTILGHLGRQMCLWPGACLTPSTCPHTVSPEFCRLCHIHLTVSVDPSQKTTESVSSKVRATRTHLKSSLAFLGVVLVLMKGC